MDTYEYMEQSHRWAAKHLPDEDTAYERPLRPWQWHRQRDVVHGRLRTETWRELGLLHDGEEAE